MPDLRGGSERIDLGGGYTLVAPGMRGRAERLPAGAAATRAAEAATPLLDDVMARTEMSPVVTVDVRATPVPGAAAATDLRDPHGDDAMLLEVPDLGPTAGQVVLSVDEAGTMTWHFPLDGGEVQPPAVRGAGGKKRFLIRKQAPAPPAAGADSRSLIGALGRKLLKVIVYPITDAIIGKPAAKVAEHWEAANRAYGVRRFSPADFRQPTREPADRDRLALTAADVQRIAGGPALLFVHGTFSTANGAFNDISPELMAELDGRYGGRLFAFNHFSLSHDPARNVEWLCTRLRELAPGAQLEVDVVCHSRGGLVARTLDQGAAVFGLDTGPVRVRRIVFVAAPNKGTLLVEPDHVVSMIDRLTTGLNLLPAGGVEDVLEGILIAVKIIGHGALKGLEGLQSMNAKGDFLRKLNAGGATTDRYFAVSANYEPTDPGLRALVRGAIDATVDRVFQGAENDLVVPELGVYDTNGAASFPIADARRLRIPGSAGLMHTNLFGTAEVERRLREWLQ